MSRLTKYGTIATVRIDRTGRRLSLFWILLGILVVLGAVVRVATYTHAPVDDAA